MNQIVLAAVVTRHRRERFPVNALFVNAQPAPCRFILKNLMRQLVDAGTGLARAGVAGDEPAATKLISLPLQAAKSRDADFGIARDEQEPNRDEGQKNSASRKEVLRMPQSQHDVWRQNYGVERNEVEFHRHALPMR